ncbi:amidohydrolase family protein [Candidatus Bipolaricaulota bacterium]
MIVFSVAPPTSRSMFARTVGCPTLSLNEILAITETAHAHGIPVTAHVDTARDVQRALEGGVDDLAHPSGTTLSNTLIEQLVAADIAMVSTLAVFGASPIPSNNLWRFAEAGGTIALGNDAGYLTGVRVGAPIEEIRALYSAGFSPMQIITFATINAAEVCRLSDRIGSLELGKQADVLVVEGDPLADVETLASTLLVIHRGSVIVDNR